MARWIIEALASRHDRSGFACGKPGLDRYLREQAGQERRRNIAAVFVAGEPPEAARVLAYYTLSAFGIDAGDLPASAISKLPRYPRLPALLIGRLAVDHRRAGEGLGSALLLDALRRSLEDIGPNLGAAFVTVEAMDQSAAAFYRHFGFISFKDREDRLFLPMESLRGLFGRRR